MSEQMIRISEQDYEDVECYQANLTSTDLDLKGLQHDLATRRGDDFAYKIVEAIKQGTLISAD